MLLRRFWMTRPTNLSEIVGQNRVKTVCGILMQSAITRDAPIPHILFSGPAGTGKTTFARALATESNCKLHKSNGGTITTMSDAHQYISFLNPKDIWFVDEVHRIPIKVCEALYTVMEDFRHDFVKGNKAFSEAIAPFTMIGATTDLGIMPKPLRDRFKFIAEFEKYSLDELSQIVMNVAKSYNFKLNKAVAKLIAKTCRGNPRHVVSRTEWVRDYMVTQQKKNIGHQELLQAISLQGFDENGLRPVDHKYLDAVKNFGPIGLRNLSHKLDVDKSTIETDIEPYLIENGRVQITTKGRMLL